MDENEIKAVSDALEQLRQGSTVSAETLAKLSGSAKNSDKAFEKLSSSLAAYSRQIGGAMSGLASGGGSFQSLAGSVDLLSTSISKVAGNFGIIGKVIGGVATGIGEAAKVALKQLDDITSNYQALGDASAGAADGIDGLYRQFNQLGNYSLPAFTKAIKANMIGMTAFKGTAAEGAEELSLVAGALTQGDAARKFLKLGISLDGVGDAVADYTATFSRLGLTQGSTTDELTKKTKDYIYEVDQIARLTGQSRAEQQKAQQQTMADARARAVLGQMSRNGEKDAAKQLSILMSSFDASTNAAIRATATGIPLTEQAQKANVYTHDVMRQTVVAVKRGEIDAVEGAARMRKALAQGASDFETQVSFAGDAFTSVAVAGEDAYAIETSVAELRKKKEYAGLSDAELVKKAQELQRDASGDLTENLTDAQLAAADAGKNIQRLSFSLAQVSVGPLKTFAEVLERATGAVSKRYGVGGTSMNRPGVDHGVPGGQAGNKVLGDTESRAAAEKYLGKKITDTEFRSLLKATHAEAQAGKGASQQEQAMIMASILNRSRTDPGGIMGALYAKNQFQSVTGTAKNGHAPSQNYLVGPQGERLKSIEGAAALLEGISKEQKNFTAASAAAYGPGTNIGYRDKMLASGGTVIGGSVFQTSPNIAGPSGRYNSQIGKIDPATTASPGDGMVSNNKKDSKGHHTESAFERFGKKLDELVALQHQNNAQNSKLLQATKAR